MTAAFPVQTFQKLGLSLLGVPYVLGAEVDVNRPWYVPKSLDCSELVQQLISAAGHPEIGDLAASQWDKTTSVKTAAELPLVGGIVVLKNNAARSNRVGHIGLTIGKGATYRYVLEARGRAYGTVLTRLRDFRNPKLRAGAGPMGIYRPLHLTGTPLQLIAWRGSTNHATVRTLQAKLKRLGYRITVDGDFGPRTQDTVAHFERMHNMLPTGAVTSDVRDAIRLALTH